MLCSALLNVVDAGVKLSFARISYGLHNASACADVLKLCKANGIRVLADECTWHGCIDAALLGVPCPSAASAASLPIASLPAALGVIDAAGGWDAAQAMLRAVKRIADKHSVTMQSVVCRWLIDQSVTPIVPMGWGPVGAALGKRGVPQSPPADAQLFQRTTFLDADDTKALWDCAK
jgi:aryl-alcohol dehydrogenase-like predicted oxidoreductase